jgi:HicB family
MPASLHRRLAQEAQAEGVSLNQWLVSLLSASSAVYAAAGSVVLRFHSGCEIGSEERGPTNGGRAVLLRSFGASQDGELDVGCFTLRALSDGTGLGTPSCEAPKERSRTSPPHPLFPPLSVRSPCSNRWPHKHLTQTPQPPDPPGSPAPGTRQTAPARCQTCSRSNPHPPSPAIAKPCRQPPPPAARSSHQAL